MQTTNVATLYFVQFGNTTTYRRLSELLKYQGIYGVEIQAFNKLILEIKKLEQIYPLVQQAVPMEKDPPLPVNSSSSPVPHALHQILRMISPPMVDNSYAWVSTMSSIFLL